MIWEDTAVSPDFLWCRSVKKSPLALPLTREALEAAGLRGAQFGCGARLVPAALNLDLVGFADVRLDATRAGRVFLVDDAHFLHHDVTRALPVEDGAFAWAYSEHLVEHVTPEQALLWLKDVRRVLRPGGLLRLTTPDLERYVSAYAARDDAFFADHARRLAELGLPGMPTRRAFMVNQIFQFWGHRWIYDADELAHLLVSAGFAKDSIRRCAFQEGALAEVSALDFEIRRDETLYVEATA